LARRSVNRDPRAERRAGPFLLLVYNAGTMSIARFKSSILETVGDTPLIRIGRMNPEPGVALYAKVEGFNPMGSVKERIALRIVEEAEKRGALKPG